MVRRLISTVVLVACAGLYTLAAAERATLILTNGERRGGEATFSDGQLKLSDAGREQSIPLDQVAVIDFAGGLPSRKDSTDSVRRAMVTPTRHGCR